MIMVLVIILALNFTYLMGKFVDNVQHIVNGKHRRMYWIREGLASILFIFVLFSLRYFSDNITALMFSSVYLFSLWSKNYYWNLEYKNEESERRSRRKSYIQYVSFDQKVEVFDVASFYKTLEKSDNWIELVDGIYCRKYNGYLKYDSIFAIEIKCDAQFEFNEHKHELSEFVDVIEGEVTLIDGRKKRSGQTFIIDGCQIHTMKVTKGLRSIHYFTKL